MVTFSCCRFLIDLHYFSDSHCILRHICCSLNWRTPRALPGLCRSDNLARFTSNQTHSPGLVHSSSGKWSHRRGRVAVHRGSVCKQVDANLFLITDLFISLRGQCAVRIPSTFGIELRKYTIGPCSLGQCPVLVTES